MSALPPGVTARSGDNRDNTARDTTDTEQNHSTAFAAALIKAQQIAAKIKPDSSQPQQPPPGLPHTPLAGVKRPLDEDFGGPGDIKRPNFSNFNMDGGMGMGGPGVTSEQVMVPDKMVGMIIGRGGEQITRLQAESGCKIQMAQESGGLPERMCTLTGPQPAIAQAKAMIESIIAAEGQGGGRGMGGGGGGGMGGGQVEMMVPGHKVGLIIGKGGETIKMLQEQTGAKIIIIQESNEHAEQKPLRISGPPEAIEEAKGKVMEILNQHEDRNGFGGRGRGRGGPGGGRGGPRGGFSGRGRGGGAGWPSGGGDGGEKTEYVMVPSSKVGLVIGKGGETIKSINQASGAHTEIDKNAPPDAREKNFIIRGPPECVDRAKQMVMEKIGLVQGTGYGSFPGQTFNPNSAGGGGGSSRFGGGGGGGGDFYQPGPPVQPGQPAINPATGQPDYSAQWAEYYRSLGMSREADMIEQQQGGATTAPPVSAGGGGVPNAGAGAPQGGGAPAPDYSAQWAEYYRSIGKTKEAEAIESQIRAKAPASGGGGPGGAPQPQYGAPGQAQYAGQPGYQPAISQAYYQPQQGGGYPGYE